MPKSKRDKKGGQRGVGTKGSPAGWVPAAMGAGGPLGARSGTPRPSRGASLLVAREHLGTGSLPGRWSLAGAGERRPCCRLEHPPEACWAGKRLPSARSLPGPPFPPQPTSLRCPRCRHPGRLSLLQHGRALASGSVLAAPVARPAYDPVFLRLTFSLVSSYGTS